MATRGANQWLSGLVLAMLCVTGAILIAGCGDAGTAVSPEDDTGSTADAGGTSEKDSGNADEDAGGNNKDGGPGKDAGTGDAGNAGDAGSDTGQVADAGSDSGTSADAGSDAGTVTDAGSQDTGSGGYHPNGWATPGSGDFHGDSARKGIASCTACHGADLNGGAGPSCNQCHSGWKTNCTFCHGGNDNQTGAPPRDSAGRTATTEISVGAHTSHVEAIARISKAWDCSECHTKPADALSPGHIDGVVTSNFGALAKTGGVSPAFDKTAQTCSNVYCHGEFTGGNASNNPKWTQVDGSFSKCGTCHDLSPKVGRHPTNFSKHSFMGKDCNYCHNGVANAAATAVTDTTKHINGKFDVSFKNGGTWNATNKSCSPSCHGTESW